MLKFNGTKSEIQNIRNVSYIQFGYTVNAHTFYPGPLAKRYMRIDHLREYLFDEGQLSENLS